MEPRLAPTNRDPKNISVLPIVISELKLGNVQRQILIADFVERADNAALKDRPETFNRVGMNRTKQRTGRDGDQRRRVGMSYSDCDSHPKHPSPAN
jgi:hypothetical protein